MLAKHALSQLSYGPIGVRRFASARPMFMLASSAGDRIRDLGCRAIRRDARSGFGLVEGVRVLPSSKGPTKMVGLGRLELPTSRLSSARSNQLSYKPKSRGS